MASGPGIFVPHVDVHAGIGWNVLHRCDGTGELRGPRDVHRGADGRRGGQRGPYRGDRVAGLLPRGAVRPGPERSEPTERDAVVDGPGAQRHQRLPHPAGHGRVVPVSHRCGHGRHGGAVRGYRRFPVHRLLLRGGCLQRGRGGIAVGRCGRHDAREARSRRKRCLAERAAVDVHAGVDRP